MVRRVLNAIQLLAFALSALLEVVSHLDVVKHVPLVSSVMVFIHAQLVHLQLVDLIAFHVILPLENATVVPLEQVW